MRPSRNRRFGHPQLVDFIKKLGITVRAKRLGVLLIGDLGQPRGGPAPSGHSSHQSGLDVDIWYWHPAAAASRALRRRERERIRPRPVVDLKKKSLTRAWSPRIAQILRAAASDERVARIFVNPVIKKKLCESAAGERNWLRKLRPWWGHHDHFHVRLACPAGSDTCEPQAALPAGDGCDELDWWLQERDKSDRVKGRKRYQSKVGRVPELPERCRELLPAQ